MNELLNRVTQQTGLSQEQTKAAVTSVIGFLKEKLPAPLASSLDSFTGEAGPAGEGVLGKAASAIGGLFGSKS